MPDRGGGRALIVEDELAWQQIVGEILAEFELQVDVAGDVDAAIALLRESAHRLAVVDLALGEGQAANKDGLRVLEAVRRHDPGCATILLTGFATVELAVRALTDYGALSCVEKGTFDRGAFRALVGQALALAPVQATALSTPPGSRPAQSAAMRGGDAAVQAPAARGTNHAGTASGNKALIVDDDAGWREILSELLEESGYQVRACSSYAEAVGHLRREPPTLAVVDLSLSRSPWSREAGSDLDGYRVLQAARDLGVASIVVSGIAATGDIGRAYVEYGAFSYVEKQTFDRRLFLQAVADACAAREEDQELAGLTAREIEVLALLAQGKTNKDIADALVISTNTVKRHLKAIFDKLGVHTRAAATAKAIGAGLSG